MSSMGGLGSMFVWVCANVTGVGGVLKCVVCYYYWYYYYRNNILKKKMLNVFF